MPPIPSEHSSDISILPIPPWSTPCRTPSPTPSMSSTSSSEFVTAHSTPEPESCPVSPAPSTVYLETSTHVAGAFDIFEQPQVLPVGVAHNVIIAQIIREIQRNSYFWPILRPQIHGDTYFRENVRDLQELHRVSCQREQADTYCLATLIDPGQEEAHWEEYFIGAGQFAPPPYQLEVPYRPEDDAIPHHCNHRIPIHEEDLLHSPSTSTASFVSSSSGSSQ